MIIKQIPNLLTLSNLFLGILSIRYSTEGNLEVAAILIFLASVFDFSDGFAARLLKAYSELGKQLDSLADLVSFGVAPAFILYGLIDYHPTGGEGVFGDYVLMYLPFILALFSAIRLAKFNIDTRQTVSFIGLPTPAAALFVASLPLLSSVGEFNLASWVSQPSVGYGVTIVLSSLLVAPIPMISLKMKNLKWKGNESRFILVLAGLVLFFWLWENSIPFIMLTYVIISILNTIFVKQKN